MTDAEVRSFFTAYGAAFLETEDAIAAFYGAPCMTARQGVVHLNPTPGDVHAFFGAVLRQYRAQGCTQGEMRRLEWMPLGANSVAATITWAYKNAADRMLWESTFTYQLYKGPDGWKILLQTMHDAS